MEAWTQYVSACMRKEESQKFDAAHFKKLMDGFAPQLVQHLAEEIPTLLALDRYDIAGVKNAWHMFDKHVKSKADTVCCYMIYYSESFLTIVRHLFIHWEWDVLTGLTKEEIISPKYRSLCHTWFIIGLAGSIGQSGDSIPTLCLERKGHLYFFQGKRILNPSRSLLDRGGKWTH